MDAGRPLDNEQDPAVIANMNNYLNGVGRKSLLLFSVLTAVISFLILSIRDHCYLTENGFQVICTSEMGAVLFFAALPVVILSLASFLFADQVFYAWRTFAFWWILCEIVISLLTSSNGGGFIGLSIAKDEVALVLSILFFIASVILIAYTAFKYRHRP